MGVLDSLKEFYANIEEGYYSFLDKIDGAGIPVYKVVDAIEANDIPSFPIAIIFTLVLAGLLAMFLNGIFFGGSQLTVFVQDTEGNSVSGASISAFVEGEEITNGITNSNGQSVLEVPLNKEVELKISKNGFNDKTSFYTSLEGKESTTITIGREITTIRKNN